MDRLKGYLARLRGYVGDRRTAPRYLTHLERSLVIYVSRIETGATLLGEARRQPLIVGYTRDVSETGLGVIVPQIRTGGLDLSIAERRLRLLLGLSPEPLEMEVAPVRYVKLERKEDEVDTGYLVGVHITEMRAESRRRYLKFLKTLQSVPPDEI
ncbi:MAG TPA: PilZ domain-containing protein [Pyrinomonadaceae bacterium]